MDQIKEAFTKVKEDMNSLKSDLSSIKNELNEVQNSILSLFSAIDSLKLINNPNQKPIYNQNNTDRQTVRHFDTYKTPEKDQITQTDRQLRHLEDYIKQKLPINKTDIQTQNDNYPSDRHINKTIISSQTDTSTHILPFQASKVQNIGFSTGNKGVSTDRQTIRQTDTSTGNEGVIGQKKLFNASSVLSQLDDLKKEIYFKIKKLTGQEMLVLSSIYQYEDQGHLVDYAFLAKNLNLTQSSIRDYVQRISLKGIPLDKEKINNKRIILHIPQELRKLATLNTLMELRDL